MANSLETVYLHTEPSDELATSEALEGTQKRRMQSPREGTKLTMIIVIVIIIIIILVCW